MYSAVLLFSVVSLGAAQQAPTPEQLFHQAVAAQREGDDTLAIRDYQELLKLHPDVVEARANLGAVFAHRGKYSDAIREYRVALQQAPSKPGIRLNLALAFYKMGDWASAGEQFEIVNKAQPDDARIAALLSDCYLRLGQNDRAIAVLLPLEKTRADSLEIAWALGSALIHAGRLKEGLPLIEKVAHEGNSGEAYLLAGNTALQLNEFELARMDAEGAALLKPDLPGLSTLKGRALEYLGDEQGAVDALEKAVKANPDDFDAQLTLGAILNTRRDLAGARSHLERAAQLRPSSSAAWFELARLERTDGHFAAAITCFEKVVRADPKWRQPHVELAALYFRMNRPQDGQHERNIVDKLTAEQQQSGPAAQTVNAPAPTPEARDHQ